jgi:AcrR family transcriptional regulator
MSKASTRKQLLSKIPKPDLRVRKSERTREAILGAAVDFLWSHPFRELTVAELMSRAGSSRSAFYPYFTDLHELMETLLLGLKQDILEAAIFWFQEEGDPLPHLQESLGGLVRVSYERGPILRAVSDAAANDERLEKAWFQFLKDFDDAVAARIEEHQAAGFTPELDARTTAMALNRMDASLLIEAFGRRPRAQPQPVLDALLHIWSSTLYCSTRRFKANPKTG